jgi:hypothetical protein
LNGSRGAEGSEILDLELDLGARSTRPPPVIARRPRDGACEVARIGANESHTSRPSDSRAAWAEVRPPRRIVRGEAGALAKGACDLQIGERANTIVLAVEMGTKATLV